MTAPTPSSATELTKPKWREVPGVVLHSEVAFEWEFYRPVVEYEYVVDGVTYRGDTIVSGLIQFNWKGAAARLINRYPVGAKIPVFVDPADPRNAALQLGLDKNFPIFALVFSALIVLFVLLFVLGRS
jgi:hypothetical protein